MKQVAPQLCALNLAPDDPRPHRLYAQLILSESMSLFNFCLAGYFVDGLVILFMWINIDLLETGHWTNFSFPFD